VTNRVWKKWLPNQGPALTKPTFEKTLNNQTSSEIIENKLKTGLVDHNKSNQSKRNLQKQTRNGAIHPAKSKKNQTS